MAVTRPALTSRSLNDVMRQLRQIEATRGKPADPNTVRELLRAELEVSADRAIQSESLAENKRQFNERLAEESKARKDDKRAARSSGVAQTVGGTASLGLAGLQTYKTIKALEAGKTAQGAIPAIGTTGTGTAQATIAPALTGPPPPLVGPPAPAIPTVPTAPGGFGVTPGVAGSVGGAVGGAVGTYVGSRLFKGKSKGVRRRAGFLSGAASGATVGSFAGPPGAFIGGIIGGVSGALGGGKP